MRCIVLIFLFFHLTEGNFECPTSPHLYSPHCYYQFYTIVGDHYGCTVNFSGSGKGALLSMEIVNIREHDRITISWGDKIISSNGSSFSVQQYFPDQNVTISIVSGDQSQMEGLFFLCPAEFETIPTTSVSLSYDQEAFILQQFSHSASASPSNLKLPMKWEVTAEFRIALISAANNTYCPEHDCMQTIWIYEGIGERAKFIGTAADFHNSVYLSENTTMTLYFVSSNLEKFSMTDATNYMAVIVNEAQNLDNCSSFEAVFYSAMDFINFNPYTKSLNVTHDSGGACLTVLNRCSSLYDCDGVTLLTAEQVGTSEFFVYSGAPHPNLAGLVLQDFRNQDTGSIFPQFMDGNVRTFFIANGSAALTFGYTQEDSVPYVGREGYLMTPFYPFNTSSTNGKELFFEPAVWSYNLTLKVKATFVPDGALAYLVVYKNGMAVQRLSFDVSTNIGAPLTISIEPGTYCRIRLFGSSVPNRGTFISYSIGEGVTPPTTTKKPSTPKTFRPATKLPLLKRLIPILRKSTTTKATQPPALLSPNSSPEVHFFTVTLFSVLLLLL